MEIAMNKQPIIGQCLESAHQSLMTVAALSDDYSTVISVIKIATEIRKLNQESPVQKEPEPVWRHP